jgi:hypothetical protein
MRTLTPHAYAAQHARNNALRAQTRTRGCAAPRVTAACAAHHAAAANRQLMLAIVGDNRKKTIAYI